MSHLCGYLINCIASPHYPGIYSGDLPGDSILYFVTSKVQPCVLPGTVGNIFLVNPQVGSGTITPIPHMRTSHGRSQVYFWPGLHVGPGSAGHNIL